MYIIGISCYYHDASAVILKDGKLIAGALEERFSRKKHDYEFPERAIDFVLSKAGIKPEEVDYVVFYEKPFLKFDRILKTTFSTFPLTLSIFREAMGVWLKEKLWIKALIKDKFGIDDDRILFSEHHISHAASAYYPSPFEEAALLTLDGVGEWATTTLGVAKGDSVKVEKELRFPHSLGLLYSAFTAFLGFKVNEGEYKVMGMAPYGKPRFVDKIYKIVKLNSDGTFHLDMSYFAFHRSTRRTFSRKFVNLFGRPRTKEESETLDPYYADIAASIQAVTEEIIYNLARKLRKETGMKNLCVAGGVALNSKANGRLLEESGFENLYIQPEAGDGGGALGAALLAYRILTGKRADYLMEHPYYGAEYGDEEIEKFLKENNIKYEKLSEEKLIERTVDALMANKVVGWHQGRFEWGPRALGSRSILANPKVAEMKDVVNRKIKFREPFRPFAPSVIEPYVEEYFDLGKNKGQLPLNFMLLVVPVREDKREEIPAVTHVDGTARPQVVKKELNSLYYKLIEAFGQASGTPVVLNTSFNLRGEPIVNTPENSFSTFARSGMDVLVMGHYFIEKK